MTGKVASEAGTTNASLVRRQVLVLLVTNIKMVGYQQFPNYVILWLTDLSPPGKRSFSLIKW